MSQGLIELSSAPAACHAAGASPRGAARYMLAGWLDASTIDLPSPEQCESDAAPGRVVSGGRFTDPALRSRLRAELPPELRDALRHDFEWYACRGAYFHTDAHYGDVLFGAFHVAGAPRDIVFARSGVRVAAVPGLWLIFDPFEPHAVLNPGELGYRRELYEAAAMSYFVGFELDLSAPVRAVFGIGATPPSGQRLASDVAVNAETGALSSVQATS